MAGAVFIIAAPRAAAQTADAVPKHVQVRGVVDGATFVETARKYLGVRYVLGGSTPRAFDCSGFVRYVFLVHGFEVPRTAHEQSGLGRRPEPDDLQPGDLLFFYGGEGAQHIAIYVGRDSIIHASSTSGHVKIDKLAGKGTHRTWFGQRLIAVRRVLPAVGIFQLPGSLAATSWAANMDSDPFAVSDPPSLF
jgi:cell wall-associated NlpC family hydrolase